MLPVTVARSCDDNAICYVLRVLWVTSRLSIGQVKAAPIGRMLSDALGAEPGAKSDVIFIFIIVTFRVSRRPREMYCGHARLWVCLCVCLSAASCLHYCMDRL